MKKISVKLENCYGIKKLDCEFDFERNGTYAIYAPNGVMKTSLAKTFKDLSQGEEPKDLIYKNRVTTYNVTDEKGTQIAPENIFVITPYENDFHSTKMSTLLVNQELKARYDAIQRSIDEKKEALLNAFKTPSGMKKPADIEAAISDDIVGEPKKFFTAILSLENESEQAPDPILEGITYSEIFNDKILKFIETQGFISQLTEYITKYNSLIESSNFFRKGVFNHYNASTIAAQLKSNGFFRANHTITLKTAAGVEDRLVANEEELVSIIEEEKERIMTDPELMKAFNKIDKAVGNPDLRSFRDFLGQNPAFLNELQNLRALRRRLWVSYVQHNKENYKNLITEYKAGEEQLRGIINTAKAEETKWRDVIRQFNDRFKVPFRLDLENQEDVILREDVPSIKFTFEDREESIGVSEKELLGVLSNGELRALYLLNIIFEVEARVHSNIETLFIIDDIADSFDYKNKYAIIEYLKDISANPIFKEIILTHNYDFYRTVGSRLSILREHRLYSERTEGGIILKPEKYQVNPFNTWKKGFSDAGNTAMLIASIPFVRNLADYSGDETNSKKLTSLLHIKSDSSSITIADLEGVFKSVLKDQDSLDLPCQEKCVIDIIHEVASSFLLENSETIELESKIVLAMAIRLKAEEFIISKINDADFVNGIEIYQTAKLIGKYKELHSREITNIKILEDVNLMTPENIHLNSFMYEPILDMSNHHLIRLYAQVIGLL